MTSDPQESRDAAVDRVMAVLDDIDAYALPLPHREQDAPLTEYLAAVRAAVEEYGREQRALGKQDVWAARDAAMRLQETVALSLSERDLQRQIVNTAKMLGWMVYHTYDSRKSEPGFPDLIMVRGTICIAAEIKAQKGQVTQAQQNWLDALSLTGVNVYVWRPDDWYSGKIDDILR